MSQGESSHCMQCQVPIYVHVYGARMALYRGPFLFSIKYIQDLVHISACHLQHLHFMVGV